MACNGATESRVRVWVRGSVRGSSGLGVGVHRACEISWVQNRIGSKVVIGDVDQI